MSDIKLDSEIFHKRAHKFLRYFKNSPPELNGCEAIVSIVGASDGELSYQKSIALQVSDLAQSLDYIDHHTTYPSIDLYYWMHLMSFLVLLIILFGIHHSLTIVVSIRTGGLAMNFLKC